jgi:hypothetical protein
VSRRAFLIASAAGFAVTAAGAQERALLDPMQPVARAPVTIGGRADARGPKLTGIFISANRRVAVIDGELYREGDEIGGLKIDRILADSVSLRRGNEAIAIRLSAEGNHARTNSGDTGQ